MRAPHRRVRPRRYPDTRRIFARMCRIILSPSTLTSPFYEQRRSMNRGTACARTKARSRKSHSPWRSPRWPNRRSRHRRAVGMAADIGIFLTVRRAKLQRTRSPFRGSPSPPSACPLPLSLSIHIYIFLSFSATRISSLAAAHRKQRRKWVTGTEKAFHRIFRACFEHSRKRAALFNEQRKWQRNRCVLRELAI